MSLPDLIIGKGEVGSSLAAIMQAAGRTAVHHDPPLGIVAQPGTYASVHLCIPFKDLESFLGIAHPLLEQFPSDTVIVHSTVGIGTTRLLGDTVSYSYVTGRHPQLDTEMLWFKRHLGCVSAERRSRAASLLRELSFEVIEHENPDAVEFGKLFDTTYYGICVAWTKLAASIASENGIDFTEIEIMNRTYNQGYAQHDLAKYARPELHPTPGPIGGHCVVPNAKILQRLHPHPLIQSVIDAA